MRSRQEAFERHPAEADAAEAVMTVAASKTVRLFLARVQKVCTARAITELPFAGARGQFITAAGDAWNLFTQGELSSWWTEAVSQELLMELANIWRQGYHNHTADVAGLDALPQYLASVKDRLSPDVGPALPADAFNMARSVLTNGLAVGDSNKEIARRLAATFDWAQQTAFWEKDLAHTGAMLDRLLDAIGNPGDAARELAKRSDPKISALIRSRSATISRIDSARSTWESRATTIARTEATGALNAGAVQAMATEGVSHVEWVASMDRRTRPHHWAADGQQRPLGVPFNIGVFLMFHPGDPTAPASETANCRCAVIGAEATTRVSEDFEQVRQESKDRAESIAKRATKKLGTKLL